MIIRHWWSTKLQVGARARTWTDFQPHSPTNFTIILLQALAAITRMDAAVGKPRTKLPQSRRTARSFEVTAMTTITSTLVVSMAVAETASSGCPLILQFSFDKHVHVYAYACCYLHCASCQWPKKGCCGCRTPKVSAKHETRPSLKNRLCVFFLHLLFWASIFFFQKKSKLGSIFSSFTFLFNKKVVFSSHDFRKQFVKQRLIWWHRWGLLRSGRHEVYFSGDLDALSWRVSILNYCRCN